MNALLHPLDCDTLSLLSPKAASVWKALQSRYGSQVSQKELDHLLALYVFGLTNAFYSTGSSNAQLDACRALLLENFDDGRTELALRNVPPTTQWWVERAFQTIEHFGLKDGRGLLEDQQKPQLKIEHKQVDAVRDSNGTRETA